MIKVYRSAIINAAADEVWKLVRDFNGLPKWHPAIATSEIEGGLPADRVGCVRRFTRKSDGGLLRGEAYPETTWHERVVCKRYY